MRHDRDRAIILLHLSSRLRPSSLASRTLRSSFDIRPATVPAHVRLYRTQRRFRCLYNSFDPWLFHPSVCHIWYVLYIVDILCTRIVDLPHIPRASPLTKSFSPSCPTPTP